MNDISDRIKLIRQSNSLSQGEFGKRIHLSASQIACYENRVRTVTDRAINDICREFDINKNWLLHGEGEMIHKMSSDEEFLYLVGKFSAENDEFKKRIIKGMLQLTDRDSWELVVKMVEKLAQAEENSSEE